MSDKNKLGEEMQAIKPKEMSKNNLIIYSVFYNVDVLENMM